MLQGMSGVRRDFIACHLRSQLGRLKYLLEIVESQKINSDYAQEYIKRVEEDLRQIRKLCVCN